MEQGLSIIRSSPHLRDIQIEGNRATFEMDTDDQGVSDLMVQLVQKNVAMSSFSEKDPTLEDVFMTVTKGLVT